MYIFMVFILTSIVYILLVFLDAKRKKRKQQNNGDDVMALDLTPEEFYKVLNFMLMYGIIDFTQYNNLELKSLPYVKRSV